MTRKLFGTVQSLHGDPKPQQREHTIFSHSGRYRAMLSELGCDKVKKRKERLSLHDYFLSNGE